MLPTETQREVLVHFRAPASAKVVAMPRRLRASRCNLHAYVGTIVPEFTLHGRCVRELRVESAGSKSTVLNNLRHTAIYEIRRPGIVTQLVVVSRNYMVDCAAGTFAHQVGAIGEDLPFSGGGRCRYAQLLLIEIFDLLRSLRARHH